MSESLKTLIDKYVKSQKISIEGSDEEKKEVITAAKERLYDKIYQEVKEEVKEKALEEADDIIDERKRLRQLSELKKLVWSGFLVAFFVGILVNQVTDIIGYLKGSVSLTSIWPTVAIIIILLIICIMCFGWAFVSEILKILRKEKNEND